MARSATDLIRCTLDGDDAAFDALESLPESERTILTLHYLGGLTCEEVSRFIGTSRGAILDRLYRARRCLKKEMLTAMEQTFGTYQLPPTLTHQIVEQLRPSPPQLSPKPIVPWVTATLLTAIVLYFYTIQAGRFADTRKMILGK